MSTDIVNYLATACSNLSEVLSSLTTEDQCFDAVITHIKKLSQDPKKVGDFKEGLEWFNISSPLSLNCELKGKVVVLDFFTYCCINCMHILPDLKLLENKYSVQDGLVVVGVHSAKFDNEKDSTNILAAVQRYEISHAVVNDGEGIMWNQLGIPCWPTLLILGPDSEPLFILMGEGKKEDLFLFVNAAINYFKTAGKLSDHPLSMVPFSHITAKAKGPLWFPGKITTCHFSEGKVDRERLAVSDTGHHRLLIILPDGQIEFIIGSGNSGFIDGNFTEAQFHGPQGLVFLTPYLLYVADTENHAIRMVDLKTMQVTTVAGTGCQGSDHAGGEMWTKQVLSSPWDIALTSSAVIKQAVGIANEISQTNRDVLLIAMAGLHQIWALFLEDCCWWKGKSYVKGTCVAIVGSGKEENRNNSYPHAAAFAQPSGLSVTSDLATLFVADSESSSVRKVSIVDGKVTAVAGGDRSPTNLFGFGDIDGKQYEAKLQHPLAIAWNAVNEKLYVADSYNHKLKVVDAKSNVCTTLLGSGHPGNSLGDFTDPQNVQLNEPGGMCASVDGRKLYVADTNNHCIKVVDFAANSVEELVITAPSETDSVKCADVLGELLMSPCGGDITLALAVSVDEMVHLTPGAPQKWTIKLPGEAWSVSRDKGDYAPEMIVNIKAPPSEELDSSEDIFIEYRLFLCRGDVECFVRKISVRINIKYVRDASKIATLKLAYSIN